MFALLSEVLEKFDHRTAAIRKLLGYSVEQTQREVSKVCEAALSVRESNFHKRILFCMLNSDGIVQTHFESKGFVHIYFDFSEPSWYLKFQNLVKNLTFLSLRQQTELRLLFGCRRQQTEGPVGILPRHLYRAHSQGTGEYSAWLHHHLQNVPFLPSAACRSTCRPISASVAARARSGVEHKFDLLDVHLDDVYLLCLFLHWG